MVESGECLIRMRPRLPSDGLAVAMQLQVLECDYLYEFKDGPLPSGGWIDRGIEYDGIGRRVAYWLYRAHPGSVRSFAFGQFSRVPAGEVIHLFRADRPGQERGVSWLAPVIIRLRELDIYEDAYLKRQQLANLFALFVMNESDDTAPTADDSFDLQPGAAYKMKVGQTVEFSNPPKADDYGPYTLANLKAVATGLGITYESLTGDLSDVNFSSARMGWQEFGRAIDAWRWQLFIPRVCYRMTAAFAQVAGIDGLSAEYTPLARIMVDPAREIPPIISAVRAGLKTLPEAVRELGYDFNDVMDEIKASNDYLDQLGLVLDSDPRKTASSGGIQNTGNSNGTNDPTNP